MDVEQKIKNTSKNSGLWSQSDDPLPDSCIRTEDFKVEKDIKMEIENDEYDKVPVQPEYVGIKLEPNEQGRYEKHRKAKRQINALILLFLHIFV